MYLVDLLARYRAAKLKDASPNTDQKFRQSVAELARVVGRPPTLADLTDANIDTMMVAKSRQGRSPASVNTLAAKLCALWTWAHRKGITTTGPDVQMMREPRIAPVAWSREQLDQVFDAVAQAEGNVAGVPAPLFWRCLLSILWDTGERRGAVVNQLPWENLAHGQLLVPASARKGKTRDMVYTLHPDTVRLCEMIRGYGLPSIIYWDRTVHQLANRYRTILKRAGLPHDRKHLFHCIRRSVASHGAAAGADASQLLDHSDPSITRRYYLDPRIVPAPRAVDVLFRPDSPRPAA